MPEVMPHNMPVFLDQPVELPTLTNNRPSIYIFISAQRSRDTSLGGQRTLRRARVACQQPITVPAGATYKRTKGVRRPDNDTNLFDSMGGCIFVSFGRVMHRYGFHRSRALPHKSCICKAHSPTRCQREPLP